MERATRSKVRAGELVLKFSMAHPDPEPSHRAVLAGYEKRLGQVLSLAARETAGRRSLRLAGRRQEALRVRLQAELLRHLSRLSEVALSERPDLVSRFAQGVFEEAANSIIAEADSIASLLVRHRLSDEMSAELRTTLRQLDAAAETTRRNRTEHDASRLELTTVIGELDAILAVLDGLNRNRFRDDPAVLAEWERATRTAGGYAGCGPGLPTAA